MTDYYTACEEMRERSMRGGWISVKDRLPDLDGGDTWRYSDDVLIFLGSGMVAIATLTEPNGEPYWSSDNLNGPTRLEEVTHWMPLPKAPKAEEGRE